MDESTNEKRSSFKNKIAEFCQTAAPVVRHVKEDIHSLVEESKKLVLFSDAEKDQESLEQKLVEDKATCDANQVILNKMCKIAQNDQVLLTDLLGKEIELIVDELDNVIQDSVSRIQHEKDD